MFTVKQSARFLPILLIVCLAALLTSCSTQSDSSDHSGNVSASIGNEEADTSANLEDKASDAPRGTESGVNEYGTPIYSYDTGIMFDPARIVQSLTYPDITADMMIGDSISDIMYGICDQSSIYWEVVPASDANMEFEVTVGGNYMSSIDSENATLPVSVTYLVTTSDGGITYSAALESGIFAGEPVTPADDVIPLLAERADASVMFDIMYFDFGAPEQVIANQVQYYSQFDHDKYTELKGLYTDWANNMSQVGSDPQ